MTHENRLINASRKIPHVRFLQPPSDSGGRLLKAHDGLPGCSLSGGFQHSTQTSVTRVMHSERYKVDLIEFYDT